MSTIKVPGSVRRVLEPEEKVVGKTGNFSRDFYATNTRILVFERPSWLVYSVWILLGILWAVLGLNGYYWLILFAFLICLLAYLFMRKSSPKIFTPYPTISAIILISDRYWQIELKGGGWEKEKYIWRIPKYPRGVKLTEATEFVKIVSEKANVKVS
jgi:hypothetical protein